MDRRQRIDLEVRTILVTWQSLMRSVRRGDVPDSRRSISGATVRALEQLRHVEDKFGGGPDDERRYLAHVLAPARAEIHGATHHDLADSGESAG